MCLLVVIFSVRWVNTNEIIDRRKLEWIECCKCHFNMPLSTVASLHRKPVFTETCHDRFWGLETCYRGGVPIQILKRSAQAHKITFVLKYQTRLNWSYLVYFQVVISIFEWSSMCLIQVSFRRSILDIISTCRSVETSCNAACCWPPVRLASLQATLCSVRSNLSCLCFWIVGTFAVSVRMQL